MSRPSTPDAKDQRLAELERQLAEAQALIRTLQARVAELEQTGQRQATPFRRRERKAQPEKPGRKAGAGVFAHRAPPAVTEHTVTKVAPGECCPDCGGTLTECREHEQWEVDIPDAPPVVTRFVMKSGHCAHCQKRVRLSHPDQISTATGAAGVVIGPRAKALAADLKHRLGVSFAKVGEILNEVFHLNVTRSGWCQAAQHLAETARPVYEALIEALRACAVVHGDETSWRIGALSAWLWVFCCQHITVYTIAASRSHEVIVTILGREFRGVLVADCFSAYDHHALAAWLKQKCLSHLLKDLKEMAETKTRGAVRFARAVTAVLQAALALKAEKSQLAPAVFTERAQALETQLDALIDPKRQLTDEDHLRFAKRLRKQRPHVLRFLYVDELDATNNQAERMLRPAVITRKTNGCNRTADGAEAHATLASLLATCRQQAINILDYLIKLQRFGDQPPDLAPPNPTPT
jgi:transposase